jgi:hypothetical protein
LDSGKGGGDDELTEKEIIRAERNSGVVSGRVREIQVSAHITSMNSEESSGLLAQMCELITDNVSLLMAMFEKLCAVTKLPKEDGAEDAEGRGPPHGTPDVQVSETMLQLQIVL